MTDQIEALERLVRLREQGAISEAEFKAEKVKVLASAEPPRAEPLESRRSKLPLFIGSGAVCLVAAVAFAYTQTHETSSRSTSIAAAAVSQDRQIVNEMMTNSTPADEPTAGSKVEDSIAPPTVFLNLCVASGRVPLGFRLRRLPDKLEHAGRTISWKPSGGSWIMIERWHDDLSDRDHELSFLFTAVPGAETMRYCRQDVGEVQIERIIADHAELTGTDMGRVFDDHAKDLYMKEIQPIDEINAERRRNA